MFEQIVRRIASYLGHDILAPVRHVVETDPALVGFGVLFTICAITICYAVIRGSER